MANEVYNSFKKNIGEALVDWSDNSTTTIKIMLVTSGYAVDIDGDTVVSDITNEVASGGGYTTGGEDITTRSVVQDNATDLAKYDGDDIVWATSTITARGAIIYKDTGTPSTSPLVAYIDFVTDQESLNADFTIQWSTDGIFTVS